MSVDKICNHNVVTVPVDASVFDVAARMRESHVGDVIVTEYRNGREVPIGIITDRDIVLEVLAQKIDPAAVAAKDIMSTDLVSARKDNGVEFALAAMRKGGVRRLAVVDADGSLFGILSADDVVGHLAQMLGDLAEMLQAGERRETTRRP